MRQRCSPPPPPFRRSACSRCSGSHPATHPTTPIETVMESTARCGTTRRIAQLRGAVAQGLGSERGRAQPATPRTATAAATPSPRGCCLSGAPWWWGARAPTALAVASPSGGGKRGVGRSPDRTTGVCVPQPPSSHLDLLPTRWQVVLLVGGGALGRANVRVTGCRAPPHPLPVPRCEPRNRPAPPPPPPPSSPAVPERAGTAALPHPAATLRSSGHTCTAPLPLALAPLSQALLLVYNTSLASRRSPTLRGAHKTRTPT